MFERMTMRVLVLVQYDTRLTLAGRARQRGASCRGQSPSPVVSPNASHDILTLALVRVPQSCCLFPLPDRNVQYSQGDTALLELKGARPKMRRMVSGLPGPAEMQDLSGLCSCRLHKRMARRIPWEHRRHLRLPATRAVLVHAILSTTLKRASSRGSDVRRRVQCCQLRCCEGIVRHPPALSYPTRPIRSRWCRK
jgi:hypothetical protein